MRGSDVMCWLWRQPSTTADPSFRQRGGRSLRVAREKLTLSAVASAAGVSRPTLYRWFATKADLLEAITIYEQQQFDAGLAAVIEVQRSPRRRLEAALRYLVTYLDTGTGPNSISADPRLRAQVA